MDETTGLPDRTVYRPVDVAAVPFPLPVIVWANGGCRRSNDQYRYFLTRMASYGYLVVANGGPDFPGLLVDLGPNRPELLTSSIDWAVAENQRPTSRYFRRIDTARVVVMGQSCGAKDAVLASRHERVRTTVLWNGGSTSSFRLPPDPAPDLNALRAPALYVTGGPQELQYDVASNDYKQLGKRIPAVWADNAVYDHTGLWDIEEHRNAPVLIAWRWLDFMLYRIPASRDFFCAPRCGLCSTSAHPVSGSAGATTPTRWTVLRKNWRTRH